MSSVLSAEDALALSLLSRDPRVAAQDFIRNHPQPPVFDEILAAALPGPLPERLTAELRARATAVLGRSRNRGADPLVWGGDGYPALLAAIPDAPFLLWVRGDRACLAKPAVAIVGSRAATPYGLEAASRLGADLAAEGVLVVSGLARGVDSASHRGALSAGGDTVAVLGSGVDVIYPPEHARLAAEIADHGAVVSEFVPGTVPAPFHFPARNRIISGLSLAVVVVEAAEKSGSLITAGCALEQGRAVMAVPGSVLSGRHRGCHALIRDGAAVVESAEDVLDELRGSPLARVGEPAANCPAADPLLAAMAPGESYDADGLGAETGLPTAALLPRLLELELRGAIRRVDGGRFVRAGRTC
jgi:DNA processing protein